MKGAVDGPAGAAESGQGIVEYGLILVLSVLVAAVTLLLFGGPVAEILDVIGNLIDGSE